MLRLKFGDEIVNELVAWFNEVDATYRADLRELNELNFSRFDAKLEQRVAELRAEIDRRFGAFDATLDRFKADLRTVIWSAETRIIRWMFAFWVAAAALQRL